MRRCKHCNEEMPSHRPNNSQYCSDRCRRDNDRGVIHHCRPETHAVWHPDMLWRRGRAGA